MTRRSRARPADRPLPEQVDRAVLAEIRRFFAARRNERWLPTSILQSACSAIPRREVSAALDRLTERGRIERAVELSQNPYSRAYRLAPLAPTPTTSMETT